MTRTGKIARLPHHLREALNQRLADNIPGREIVDWLNSHPEVEPLLQAHFGGDPINQQNLSNWRRGGFVEWQTRQEFFDRLQDLTESSADIDSTLPASLTEHASRLLAAHIALLLSPSSPNSPFNNIWSTDTDSAPSAQSTSSTGSTTSSLHLVKPLCALTRAVCAIRRQDLSNAVQRATPDSLSAPAAEPEIKPVKASSSPPLHIRKVPPAAGPSPKPLSVIPLCPSAPSVVKPRTLHHSAPCVSPLLTSLPPLPSLVC